MSHPLNVLPKPKARFRKDEMKFGRGELEDMELERKLLDDIRKKKQLDAQKSAETGSSTRSNSSGSKPKEKTSQSSQFSSNTKPTASSSSNGTSSLLSGPPKAKQPFQRKPNPVQPKLHQERRQSPSPSTAEPQSHTQSSSALPATSTISDKPIYTPTGLDSSHLQLHASFSQAEQPKPKMKPKPLSRPSSAKTKSSQETSPQQASHPPSRPRSGSRPSSAKKDQPATNTSPSQPKQTATGNSLREHLKQRREAEEQKEAFISSEFRSQGDQHATELLYAASRKQKPEVKKTPIVEKDTSLITVMAQRLQGAEEELKAAKFELEGRRKEATRLRQERDLLKEQVKNGDMLFVLEEENRQLQRDNESMKQFLRDYGMEWVGEEDGGSNTKQKSNISSPKKPKAKATKPPPSPPDRATLFSSQEQRRDRKKTTIQPSEDWGSVGYCLGGDERAYEKVRKIKSNAPPTPVGSRPINTSEQAPVFSYAFRAGDQPSLVPSDEPFMSVFASPRKGAPSVSFPFNIQQLLRSLDKLNYVAGEGRASVVKKENGAHKFEYAQTIPLTLFDDGFMLFSGPFRPFNEEKNVAFFEDLTDGYFPWELKERYPNGCIFAFKNHVTEKYEEWERSKGRLASGANKSKEKPKSKIVLIDGEIVDVAERLERRREERRNGGKSEKGGKVSGKKEETLLPVDGEWVNDDGWQLGKRGLKRLPKAKPQDGDDNEGLVMIVPTDEAKHALLKLSVKKDELVDVDKLVASVASDVLPIVLRMDGFDLPLLCLVNVNDSPDALLTSVSPALSSFSLFIPSQKKCLKVEDINVPIKQMNLVPMEIVIIST
ncbi:putative ubiquitin carboxyl-terminal hydrolase 12 [Blattamonas nauphoetae]|uniref:Ubiquitin carboxyl-terminal hydrolase 12 n=1 Tax=Blattamonas nauphoetae TaxID=2049346 RepID=A0ABQ9XE27_9EUKA|nr:putative ubiquitin carboxyl-terminal hydrolase 12 [Blattamonas nauphoetae]